MAALPLLLFAAPAGRVAAAPLGETTPTVFWIGQGDVDLSIYDNARNVRRVSAVAMGDLNRDGLDDLVLGDPYSYGVGAVGPPEGMVYVIYAYPLEAPTFDLTLRPPNGTDLAISTIAFPGGTPPSIRGYQVQGEFRDMRFGSALACGDFDGDGVEDLAVAAPRRLTAQAAGRVYLIRGDPSLRYQANLAALRQTGRLMTIVGPSRATDPLFGESLAFVDVDNDGRKDLIIGTPSAGAGGEVCVVYGRDFTSETLVADQVSTGSRQFTLITARAAGDRLGAAVGGGDLSGDGRADLILGAPGSAARAPNGGEVDVFFGADRDTSGNPPLPRFVPRPDLLANLRLIGPNTNEAFGSAVAVGDFDGNSFRDLAVGAPFAQVGTQLGAGRTYLLYLNGFSSATQQTVVPSSASLDVAIFSGASAGLELGSSLAFGRFDGDPLADLLMGVPQVRNTVGSLVTGAVYGVLGRGAGERPQGEYLLNGGPGSVMADLTVWSGGFGDNFGRSLALGQFDGLAGLDLLACGRPVAEGPSGSAWLLLYHTPATTIRVRRAGAQPAWIRYR